MEKLFKKISILAIAMFLLLSFSFAFTQPALAPPPPTNLSTMIVDRIGEPETVDPHWAYDTASMELIFNVYDTLIFFNREEIPKSGQFELHIADNYVIPDALTYRFHIRANVPWQAAIGGDSIYVEPSDVEYSFERALVMGASPSWMLCEPLLGTMYISDTWDLTNPTEALSVVDMIDSAIEVTDAVGIPTPVGEYLQFNLAKAYAPFEQILSQSWSSIIDLEWAAQYTWNGIWPTTGQGAVDFLATYNSPSSSPFDDAGNVMMGCGPYTFTAWVPGTWTITRFASYYLGWPAAGASSFVTTVQVNNIPALYMRQWRFDNCISDITDGPITNYINPNIRGTKYLPSLTAQAIFFNFAVPSYAPYQPYLGGIVWGGLMGDWHMRKAFTYSFNYALFLQIVGEATQPANPIIVGLPFYDPTDPKPTYNPNLAIWHFMMAWGGSDPDGYAGPTPPTPGLAWTQGFTLPIVYNTNSLTRQFAAQMWETEIQSYPFLGPVDIQPLALPWGTLLSLLYSNQLPNFMMGWLGNFADPHDFVFPLMHPDGDFAGHQNIAYGSSGHLQLDWSWLPGNPSFGTPGIPIDNAYVGALIEEGARQTGYFERNSIYRELADIYYDEAASIMLYQPLGRHWEKKWVQGWYYNPVLPGLYFYHLWKGLDADLNGDGQVFLGDVAVLNAYWWDGIVGGSVASYNRVADKHWPGRNLSPIDIPPPGPSSNDIKADTTEMDDNYYLAGRWDTAVPNCWEAFGIPAYGDGFVDIFDAALINAQWLDP